MPTESQNSPGGESGQHTPTPSDGERTVTDPVTHLNLPVHDSTLDELQAIAMSPSSEQPPSMDNFRHSQMTGLIDAESRKDWLDNTRRTKIQIASIAAVAALASSFTILLLSRVLGGIMAGWLASLFGGAMCCILGLVAAACVLYFWNPHTPQIQLHGEENQLHQSHQNHRKLPSGSTRFSIHYGL
ncbi:hypothetical protein B0H11DRAFT_521013 [Mycena galericulata]|nr:hypothetical protein B0H11DRAFT_521013 [Mycena galericulata]